MTRVLNISLPLLLATVGLSTAGCTEYDLNRPDENETPNEEPEPEEEVEPTEDPDIEVSRSEIDFGGIPKDCPATAETFEISNVGLADLEITAIELDGNGTSAFSQDGAPAVLATGESITVVVDFTPTAWLDYDVDIKISSNDPDEATVRVDLLGTGAEDEMYEEEFEQDYFSAVDILWVVDNSCSMDEEVQQVRDNFASFITEFRDLGLDYQLGVITTDMDNPADSGKLQGDIVTEDMADPEAEFLAQVDQGSSGSGSEKGFEAAMAALSEPLVSAENAGFMRDDAALSVIIVSDEDDDSSVGASGFTSWLDSLKSDAELSNFSAIVGDSGLGCMEWISATEVLQASAGDQYIDAAYATGGIHASICTSDYEEALQHLSLTSAGMTIEFLLEKEPSTLADMSVEVDSVAISNDSSNGWTYSSDNNSITFHGDGIPGPGSEVVVMYPVALECPN